MPISALLFDKDGTLFEFGTTWEAWAECFLLKPPLTPCLIC